VTWTVKFAVSAWWGGVQDSGRNCTRYATNFRQLDAHSLRDAAIEREEDKIKRDAKEAARKGEKTVLKSMAKNIVMSRKAVERIHVTKAHMNSVMVSLQTQSGASVSPSATRATGRAAGGGDRAALWRPCYSGHADVARVFELLYALLRLAPALQRGSTSATSRSCTLPLLLLLQPSLASRACWASPPP